MKVSIAVIKLVLRTNKVLSDGTHPIMLRCSFNGMKERSTGYSCTVRYWDKKSECIKKGYPNYIAINDELAKLKNDAINRRNDYIRSDSVYTPGMVLGIDSSNNNVIVRNVNLLKIATETGKAISSLHQYISYLNDDDLV